MEIPWELWRACHNLSVSLLLFLEMFVLSRAQLQHQGQHPNQRVCDGDGSNTGLHLRYTKCSCKIYCIPSSSKTRFLIHSILIWVYRIMNIFKVIFIYRFCFFVSQYNHVFLTIKNSKSNFIKFLMGHIPFPSQHPIRAPVSYLLGFLLLSFRM